MNERTFRQNIVCQNGVDRIFSGASCQGIIVQIICDSFLLVASLYRWESALDIITDHTICALIRDVIAQETSHSGQIKERLKDTHENT
jgi:hypothetical protein